MAILISLPSTLVRGQDQSYALKVIDTLCSPYMAGRGYVEKGHVKAAQYIASEMEHWGLEKVAESHMQPFVFQANTFPGEMNLSLNDTVVFIPGVDFIVDPSCPSIKGEFFISWGIQAEQINRTKAFLVVDLTQEKNARKKIESTPIENPSYRGYIFLQEEKFTWSTAMQQKAKPILFLKKERWPNQVKTLQLRIQSKLKKVKSNNVIGMIKGTQNPDKFFVISAHYDHLGQMGKSARFSGANDNASGIAYLLSLARHYALNPPPFSVLFIAFGGEEMGLLGSQHFINHALINLESINFVLNLDIMGTGEEGITVVNGTKHPEWFNRLNKINEKENYLPKIKARGEAANSDHYPFSLAGIPAFFIYTLGGNPAYHDIYDLPKNLNLSHFDAVFSLLVAFITQFP